MNRARISIIAAIGKNRELGKENRLIWRIPDDLKRVHALTMGHPIIMGRKTHESIGKPLPGRTNIVVSRSITDIQGCIVAQSLVQALEKARVADLEEIFIFGGAEIYKEAIGQTDRLYLTVIDAEDAAADAFFPEYTEDFKIMREREKRNHNGLAYEWITLDRI